MPNKIKPGDRLYRTKGIVQHVGIYIGNGQVAHHSPLGTFIDTISIFGDGKLVQRVAGYPINQNALAQRALQLAAQNKPYSAISYNCEHFVEDLLGKNIKSEQLQAATICGVFGALIGNSNNNPLLGATLGSLAGIVIANIFRKYDY